MLGHILTVGLIVVVAHCIALPSSKTPIPIANQGVHFPVPFVSKQKSDDFYDDEYYPDIDDESVNEVVRDNGGKGGNRGSQSNVPGRESRPSGAPTSGGRPSQSPSRGDSRPSGAPTSGGRPSQSPSRGDSRPSGFPTRDRRPSQSSRREPCPSGSPTRDRTPSQPPEGESRPSATFPSSSDRGSLPHPQGQVPISVNFPTKGWDSLPNSWGGSRPSGTFPGRDRTEGGSATSHRQNSRQQGRRQNRRQPDLSQYRNAPAISSFITGIIEPGKKPDEVKMFKTNNPKEEIATGSVDDKFEVEIIQGSNDVGLRKSTIWGEGSRLILDNPNGETVIGRINIYKA